MKRKILLLLVTINSIISFGQTVAHTPPNMSRCGDGGFNLNEQTAIILGDQNPQQFTVKYFYTLADAQANIYPVPNPSGVGGAVIPDFSNYFARVINNADGTFAITSFTTQVIKIEVIEPTVMFCESKPLFPPNIGNYYTGPNGTGTMIDVTSEQYIVTENGALFYIYAEEGGCVLDLPIVVTFYTSPIIEPIAPLYGCQLTEGFGVFNLENKIEDIINDDPWLGVSFHETEYDASMMLQPITNLTNYVNSIENQILYVTVHNMAGCITVTELELIPEICSTSLITGTLLFDYDNNGCAETSLPAANIEVVLTINDETPISIFTNINGEFSFDRIPDGINTYTVQPLVTNMYNPITSITETTDIDIDVVDFDFCITALTPFSDTSITLVPGTSPRPGFETHYTNIIKNVGNTAVNGVAVITFDNTKLSYTGTDPGVVALQNTLTIDYSLLPFDQKSTILSFMVSAPPTLIGGEILNFSANLNPISNDENAENNLEELNQVVVNSYDPNDIAVREGEFITEEQAGEYLNYVVRFQNTGTADAINIRIVSTLDENLDWNTFTPIATSHTTKVNRIGNEIEYLFDNIHLPDSLSNEKESHGFIVYKIKPKADIVLGDIMTAQAHIYFDFNPAIDTNIVTTTIQNVAAIKENNITDFIIYPNPASGKVSLLMNTINASSEVTILDVLGKIVVNDTIHNNQAQMDISNLKSGIYFVTINSDGMKQTKKLVVK